MAKKALIIVESPTKIKTLQKFLGKEFIFASSLGHVRDLPAKEFGIDLEQDFEPTYVPLSGKEEVIENLRKAAAKCDIVYLSPDPDREGEAIAWHIASLLPPETVIKRAAFHAITKEAVLEALKNPQSINLDLVNAQQTRRLLDRIVGYKISPILARKLKRRSGISAGRVQSVALKLIVDREREIERFKPVEYWNIRALLSDGSTFTTRIYAIDGKRWEKEPVEGKEVALIANQATADAIVKRLYKAQFHVSNVEKKEKRRHPEPPFITSTLQQEASRHLRFSADKTMRTAQSLYEGVDLGSEGTEGLITYMRTDSVRVEPQAIAAARSFIETTFGTSFLPETARVFKTKKSAQDAHEAIRPTNLNHPPEKVRPYLSKEQFALYELIWKRFIASQMNSAIYDTVLIEVATDQGIELRATGSTMKFAGFLALYEEKLDEEESEENPTLPPLEKGEKLKLVDVQADQAFTKPPPRFSEASLVKELERLGIGRPSTYAPIMNKIQSREYTIKENQRLKPTELGRLITEFLEENFQEIMEPGFTAALEDSLELIADHQKEWKEILRDFWLRFAPHLETASKAMVPKVLTDIPCPKCTKPLQKIWSKRGYFLGCSGYPDCDYTASEAELSFRKEDYAADFNWEQPCPQCGKPMNLRHGRFGPFLGCSNYPECKGIVNIPQDQSAMPDCPAIGCDGKMTARRSRFGTTFYSCSNYPECDVIISDVNKVAEKYPNHPKTPYVSKKKAFKRSSAKAAGGKGKGEAIEKKSSATSSKPAKKAAPKKSPAAKKPAAKKKK